MPTTRHPPPSRVRVAATSITEEIGRILLQGVLSGGERKNINGCFNSAGHGGGGREMDITTSKRAWSETGDPEGFNRERNSFDSDRSLL